MSQSLIFPEEYSNASPLKHFNTFSVSQYLTDNNYTQQSSYIPRFSDDEASNDAELDAVQSYDIDSQQWAPNGSNPADDSLYALSGMKGSRRSNPAVTQIKWSQEEDDRLRGIVTSMNGKNWKKIAALHGNTRTDVQCLHRWNKVLKPGLHKGSWTSEEDDVVRSMVLKHGVGKVKWSEIASKLPGRIGKQCRERWFNHLDPTISKKDWAEAEDIMLYRAQRQYGNRWHDIAKMLPGRTENAVKNRWNSSALKKWLLENQHMLNSLSSVSLNSMVSDGYGYSSSSSYDVTPNIDANNFDIETGTARKRMRLCNPEELIPMNTMKEEETHSLPDYLRPPRINTTKSSKINIQHDSDTNSILSILTEMKSSPANRNDLLDSYNNPSTSNNMMHSIGNMNQLCDIEVFCGSNNRPPLPHDKLKTVAFDESDITVMENMDDDSSDEGSLPHINIPRSPTSEALARFRTELDKLPSKTTSKSLTSRYKNSSPRLDDASLIELLPHFKYLNEDTQRRIMKQLISKVNSTSFTPRNYCSLGTPMYSRTSSNETIDLSTDIDVSSLGSPTKILGSIDPNCFEMNVDEQRGIALNSKSGKNNDNNTQSIPQSSDELMIGAVVSVALQLATKKISPELKTILNESYTQNMMSKPSSQSS